VQVLLVLFGSLLLCRLLGVAAFAWLTWEQSARVALAAMFVFTGVSHFAPMKEDLIAMVPPALPRPDLLVFMTGLAELAGAIGLLVPLLTFWAAWALVLLLVMMLPANISAATRGVLLRGRRPTPLWLRVPMQVLFILWAWAVR